MKKLIAVVIGAILVLSLVGCSGMPRSGLEDYSLYSDGYFYDGNNFDEIYENPFVNVTEQTKTSSIALTVNTAGYTQVKSYIEKGIEINKNAVKIEEMINFFEYGYDKPDPDGIMALCAAVFDNPFNSETKLITVGMQAEEKDFDAIDNNIVFLIDVSGSMAGKDRIDLLKTSLISFADALKEGDKVSVVTYAGGVKTVLDGAPAGEKSRIKNAINSLQTGGSTSGGDGIVTAYDIAKKHQTAENNSVIIIATDGDFNVGAQTPKQLKELIKDYRAQGIYLSALGFGFGNFSDANVQEIVASGQGSFAYIPDAETAKKVLNGQKNSVLHFVAEEAKAQIEFNPAAVEKYRLIGFENKRLTSEEFASSDTVAGSVSSGASVTAVYEIVLKSDTPPDKIADFTVRFKTPRTRKDQEISLEIGAGFLNAFGGSGIISLDDRAFIASIVEFALILRNSDYKAGADLGNIVERLASLDCVKTDPLKNDFKKLVGLYSASRASG